MSKGGYSISIPFDPVNFDIEAFSKFIVANGIKLTHYKAIKCPIGMIDPMDMRQPNHDGCRCSNGFIYKFAGSVTATFSNNSVSATLTDMGILDGSTFQASFPQFYDGTTEQVYVQLFDRFYLKDLAVLVPNTELIESHIMGVDNLTYKAEKITDVIDANGQEYSSSDFIVQDNKLLWTGDNRPRFDANLNKGVVVSVRYLYTPYFYAQRMMHEVRIYNKVDFKTGIRTPVRAPIEALLSREYYMYKKEKSNDPQTDSGETLPAPGDSMFGPK